MLIALAEETALFGALVDKSRILRFRLQAYHDYRYGCTPDMGTAMLRLLLRSGGRV